MKLPPRFELSCDSKEFLVCKLYYSFYGIMLSRRIRYSTLNKSFVINGSVMCVYDCCLFDKLAYSDVSVVCE